MNIIKVLEDSLVLLRQRPQLFVPKITSALISSYWIIYLFTLVEQAKLQELVLIYLLTVPLITLLGVYVPVLTAEMIRNRDRENILRESIVRSGSYWKEIVSATFFLLSLLVLTSMPASLGILAFFRFGEFLFGVIGIAISVTAILIMGFAIYFLPISLITQDGLLSGIKDSASTSYQNRNEVLLLMLFSFTLFGLAFTAQGLLRDLGLLAFILGRVLSATVTTYTFVVSPNYYLKQKEK